MSRKKKKQTAAKAVVICVVALCLMVLAIFGIWVIGELSGDGTGDDPTGKNPGLSDDSDPNGEKGTVDSGTVELIEKYRSEMLSQKELCVFYGETRVQINAEKATAPCSSDELKAYLVSKGIDGKTVDNYIALGHSPEIRTLDEAYISSCLDDLNNRIHADKGQGYSVSDTQVTVYRGTEQIDVDVAATTEKIAQALNTFRYDDVEASVIVSQQNEPNWEDLYKKVTIEAKDAYYTLDAVNGDTVLVPEVVGRSVNIDELKRLYSISTEQKVSLDFKKVYPDVTTSNIEAITFPNLLSSYQSWYNGNEENRTNNMKLAANAINGTVILPGERFSFNHTVGERTEEAGYLPAIVYTRDGMSDGLGGGICQVSSTLYCSVLMADLKVVERWNHCYTVSYVDLGLDATVSYGWLDFRFENSYEEPIMIKTSASDGVLTIKIYGTQHDDLSVYLEYEKVSTEEPEIVTVVDKSLGETEYVLSSKGKNGYVINTYKSVAINGSYVTYRELISTDTYTPLPGKALVGEKWVETEATTESSAVETDPPATTAETSDTAQSTDTSDTTASEATTASEETDQNSPPAA